MSILDGLRLPGHDNTDAVKTTWNHVLAVIDNALNNPPQGVLDDMLDAYDGHTSLRVDVNVDGYICIAPGCGVRSASAERARQHAMAAALAAAAGGDQ